MKNRLLLVVIFFFVLGSAMVSSVNSLSSNFKSDFFGIAMTVLITIGLVSLNNEEKKRIIFETKLILTDCEMIYVNLRVAFLRRDVFLCQ